MAADPRKLAERQILKAITEGKLDGLDGEGEPLPERPGDALIDPADAVGHRIMAEAGALPEEIKLKKQLQAAKEAWAATEGEAASKDLMKEIARLEMEYSIAVEARRKFLGR
ncbi:DUF1992 domain-containing protein [Roseovarius sp. 2305UL8-3]|uniref:DnaJ family domain-containing protein n=1 Tax=Roseovarius conchicola TaxID=3121636 RepID=UPI0035285382